MKQFIILLKDKQRGTLKDDLLHAHINHLKELKSKNILVMCGPFTDNDGAIKIIKANHLEDAKIIANCDPFTKKGYYQNYEIYEFIEANEENNYLL